MDWRGPRRKLSAEEKAANAARKATREAAAMVCQCCGRKLLANTKEGYFADPLYGGNRNMVAWRWIGFPGARADFTDWIDRPGRPYPFGPVSIGGQS